MAPQVCSRNPGKISFTLPGKQPSELDFKAVQDPSRGTIGVCDCSSEEAAHLLGKIGGTAFFKPGPIEVGSSEPSAPPADSEGETNAPPAPDAEAKTEGDDKGGDEEKPGNEDDSFTFEAFQSLANANQLKARLKECGDKEVVMQCIQAEANREDGARSTWMEPLNARLEELSK